MDNKQVFSNTIQQWIGLEHETIGMANELMSKTNNPYLRTFIDIIKMDSEKHLRILETIRLCMESHTVFSPDDLNVLSSFIDKHDRIEHHAISTAKQALEMVQFPIPKVLLSHLVQDEESHNVYIKDISDLKLFISKQTQ